MRLQPARLPDNAILYIYTCIVNRWNNTTQRIKIVLITASS